MGAELALVEHEQHETAMVPKALGGLAHLGDYARLADAICRTEMVPQTLRGRADAVLAVVMYGYEIGIGPMQALQSVNLIQGKPSQSSELMRARIVQEGHQFRVTPTDEQATVQYRRKEWPTDEWSTATYTIEDARAAGLVEWYERWTKTERGGNRKETWNPHHPQAGERPQWADEKAHRWGDNWIIRPRAMLSARATSEAARLDFADVIAGLSYTPEEVAEFAPVPAGLSEPGEVSVVDAEVVETPTPQAVDSDADAQMHELGELIEAQSDEQRPLLLARLRQDYGAAAEMKPADIPAAIALAAGWPATANPPTAEQPQTEQYDPARGDAF